jgi:hypothetical protein
LILAIAGSELHFVDDLDQVLAMNDLKAGEAYEFLVARGGREFNVQVIGDLLTPKLRGVLQAWVGKAQLQLTKFGELVCDPEASAVGSPSSRAWEALLRDVRDHGSEILFEVKRVGEGDVQIQSKAISLPPGLDLSTFPGLYSSAAEKLRVGDYFTFYIEPEEFDHSFTLKIGKTPGYISLKPQPGE